MARILVAASLDGSAAVLALLSRGAQQGRNIRSDGEALRPDAAAAFRPPGHAGCRPAARLWRRRQRPDRPRPALGPAAARRDVRRAERAEPCAGSPFGFEWFPLSVDRIAGRIEGAKPPARSSSEFLTDLWAQTGLAPASTVLVGFSQGAMMALHVGTALDQRTRAASSPSRAPSCRPRVSPRPLRQAARRPDPRRPRPGGRSGPQPRQAATELVAAGFEVTLHISPGTAHGIAPDGLDFATAFLLARLPLTPESNFALHSRVTVGIDYCRS